MVTEIQVYETKETIDGFTFQNGFASWTDDSGVRYATSGWKSQGLLFVYRLIDGEWTGEWDWQSGYCQIIDAIEEYKSKKPMSLAIAEAEKISLEIDDDLFTSSEEIKFTNVVAGKKCCDGGEYGFYTIYTPANFPGVYKVRTETTCDFDRCGTGPCGFEALSTSKYKILRAESDRIEAEGSLY